MTFLETLQAHKGGLLRLKTELYWYGSRGWDGSPDRICLLLDAAQTEARAKARRVQGHPPYARTTTARTGTATAAAATYLLIDGSPHWVWVAEEDVEIL